MKPLLTHSRCSHPPRGELSHCSCTGHGPWEFAHLQGTLASGHLLLCAQSVGTATCKEKSTKAPPGSPITCFYPCLQPWLDPFFLTWPPTCGAPVLGPLRSYSSSQNTFLVLLPGFFLLTQVYPGARGNHQQPLRPFPSLMASTSKSFMYKGRPCSK